MTDIFSNLSKQRADGRGYRPAEKRCQRFIDCGTNEGDYESVKQQSRAVGECNEKSLSACPEKFENIHH